MAYVIINNESYFYEVKYPSDIDPEKTILFVHGAGGNHYDWRKQIESLGEKYLVIALDLPGHGESGGKSMNDIYDYTLFVKDFVEHVIGIPFILVGHSMGGAIAQNFALNYPDMLNALVLVGTGARLKVAPAILNTFSQGKLFRQLIDFAYRKQAPNDLLIFARNEMEKVSPKVFFNDFSACNKFDITDQVYAIQTKTLVISADEDNLTPLKYGEYLHQNIPDSKLIVIKEAGHMMMIEQPEHFNQGLRNFIEEEVN